MQSIETVVSTDLFTWHLVFYETQNNIQKCKKSGSDCCQIVFPIVSSNKVVVCYFPNFYIQTNTHGRWIWKRKVRAQCTYFQNGNIWYRESKSYSRLRIYCRIKNVKWLYSIVLRAGYEHHKPSISTKGFTINWAFYRYTKYVNIHLNIYVPDQTIKLYFRIYANINRKN